MPPPPVTTRFAPSPTGALHLGNLRTALFNALLAAGAGGVFILRIEDTDRARGDAGAEARLLADLHWLGLRWQEGPDVGGSRGPYRQSERSALYARHFDALESAGHAYPCFCSDAELARVREAQREAGQPPRYPGTCARLDPREARRRIEAGERPTLRLRVPEGRTVIFEDTVRGRQSFATEALGDFIIRRSDGRPAFLFGNAVDDALMEVTHVVRGEDHLANTASQLLLLEALDLPAPRYAHLSLIVDAQGRPLSKRAGADAVRDLREGGYRPEALINHLARLGHSLDTGELLDLYTLAARFDLARVARAPARHDPSHLRHWQRRAVEALDVEAFFDWVREASLPDGRRVDDVVPGDVAGAFVEAVRANVTLPADAAEWAARLFTDSADADAATSAALDAAGPAFFDAALEADVGTLESVTAAIRAATGARGRALYQPLRAAVTGRIDGPELGKLWTLMTKERIRARLREARARAIP